MYGVAAITWRRVPLKQSSQKGSAHEPWTLPMPFPARNWDKYSRQSIDFAHNASFYAFTTAKLATRFGFSLARGVATTAASTIDIALFGSTPITTPLVAQAVSAVINVAEQITLAPIHLSEYITSTSLIAAHSSINLLSVIFPGSSDASFSLASVIALVHREWTQQADGNVFPESHKKYGFTQVARAVVAWVALQGVTQEWQERRWFKYLREIDVNDPPLRPDPRPHRGSRIRVTSDVIFPGQRGPQIIAADIGEAPVYIKHRPRPLVLSQQPSQMTTTTTSYPSEPAQMSNTELKATLRRLVKMVMAGYGGASLLFFGVTYPSASSNSKGSTNSISGATRLDREKSMEEAELTHAIDASEAEAAGVDVSPYADGAGLKGFETTEYSWWDVLLGKHDQELFERAAGSGSNGNERQREEREKAEEEMKKKITAKMKATAVAGNEHLMPRFWVLTDHGRSQIVLVIRGTMSLNEIAVDLTCDPEVFQPASEQASEQAVPGECHAGNHRDEGGEDTGSKLKEPVYHLHGGMWRMACAMAAVGKPVQLAVLEALRNNPGFDLVVCGHSLGAGVAAIIGMMWADPRTCRTVRSSGLPPGRRTYVYCFAPPTVTDPALSRFARKLIVSLVYSHDVVARLSLGSTRDLKNAAMWLCDAQSAGRGDGWAAVTERARAWKAGRGRKDDLDWFIAIRKTLEANMQNPCMVPPGRVLWSMREGDLHIAHRRHGDPNKLRLFEVLDAEQVFSQMTFARNMLSAHLPHQIDRVLHDLL